MYLLRLDQGKKINNYQVLKRWITKGILKTIRLKKISSILMVKLKIINSIKIKYHFLLK